MPAQDVDVQAPPDYSFQTITQPIALEKNLPILSTSVKSSPAPPIGVRFDPNLKPKDRAHQGSQSSYFTAKTSRHKHHGRPAKDGQSTPSFNSSDQGYSTGSTESDSSMYLSPPAEALTDSPPYKPSRSGTISLTMMRRPSSLPNGFENVKVSYRWPRFKPRERFHMLEHRHEPYWWLPQPSRNPNSAVEARQLRSALRRQFRKKQRRGMENVQGQYRPILTTSLAPPVVSRPWSSIEIGSQGANQLLEQKRPPVTRAFPSRSRASTISLPHRPPRKSSDDMVETIRQKLMSRRISSTRSPTPAEITLRRASGAYISNADASIRSSVRTVKTLVPAKSISGDTAPRALSSGLSNAKYLITSKDIDAITALIESSLKPQAQDAQHNIIDDSTISTPNAASRCRGTSFTEKGMIVTRGKPSISSAIKPEVASSVIQQHDAAESLQHAAACTKPRQPSIISRCLSRKSEHEVIWQGGSDVADSGCKANEHCCADSEDYEEDSPHSHSPEIVAVSNLRQLSDHAFDPKNADESINTWRSELPNDPIVVETLQSQSNRAPGISITKPTIVGQKVTSFPPLPRRTTADWYSPLPDMSDASSTEPQAQNQTLHDLGIDACTGPKDRPASPGPASPTTPLSLPYTLKDFMERQPSCEPIISAPTANRDQFTNVFTGKEAERRISIVDDKSSMATHPRLYPSEGRRKSSIRIHPTAIARVGTNGSIGSSLGVSAYAKRKMSTHVAVVDNAHKGERGGTWVKPRQDSGYPTTTMLAATDPEDDDEEEDSDESEDDSKSNSTSESRRMSRPKLMKSGLVDRMALIRDRSSHSSNDTDHAWIYAQTTGSQVKKKCNDMCKPKDCQACGKSRAPSVDWIG